MRMRHTRTLPTLLGIALLVAVPVTAVAQTAKPKRVRHVPYHMLLIDGADAHQTDAALANAVRGAQRSTAPGGMRAQQTQYVPYYGQSKVRYDKFDWYIYRTDHFEIFYYPALEQHLQRIASYAESAYQHISGELQHDLADRVPLVVFKTESEFQENNISPETPEGVLAFAEPERNRMVLPIDEPNDRLYSLITHELTHIFEFNIIPRGLVNEGLPLWVDEGLAEFMTGDWIPGDRMEVRDAALTDNVPKMSRLFSAPLGGRTPYALGHATFEFIESRWGKDGLRTFLFALRKSVLGGGETAYEEALKLKPADFDDEFDRYLKERFKPFRDKQRPADYGRNIAPDPERSSFSSIISLAPSPSGDLLAAAAGNPNDQELDVILISAHDGQFIRNLTSGLDKDRGFERIGLPGGHRGYFVPWIAWAPVGDRLAYFARTEKSKSLIVQNVVSGRTEKRFGLTEVDGPESPAFSPDGRKVAFAAMTAGLSDIYSIDIESGALTNITRDNIADYSPAFSPDGTSIVYTARVGANDKLFQITLATGAKRQITFGSHDDTNAKFLDDHTLIFTSMATDPSVSLPIAIARDGTIPNVWALDLSTNQLRQMTDAATGNFSPVVLHQESGSRIAFVNYYKGRYGVHSISSDTTVAVVATEDFGGPGPVFEFTAPLSHTLLRDNIRRKGAFEKMSLAGRPPVALGVTSGGDLYGNTQVTFTDVLGDKEVSFYAQSVLQYRTMAFTYSNIGRRMNYAIQAFSQDIFYFGQDLTASGALYDPAIARFIDRDDSEAVQSQRGGSIFGIYPFNRYARVQLSGGYMWVDEHYRNDALQELAEAYQIEQYGQTVFRVGHMLPLGVTFIKDTSVFREYGPVAGSLVKVSYEVSPALANGWLSQATVGLDARYYLRIAANGVLALRFFGQRSGGTNADFFNFGGNSEMRGYEYLEFIGHKGFFANAELRFPVIEAMLTPIGVLGGLRGTFFANVGAVGFNNQPFKLMTTASRSFDMVTGYELDSNGNVVGVQTQPVDLSGLRLVDGRASYGLSLQSFLLGFPMHFDFSWRTLFDRDWEDALFRDCRAVSNTFVECTSTGDFRKMQFDFWIGYDF